MRNANIQHDYPFTTSELNELLERAAEALAAKYKREGTFTNPTNVKEYLKLKLGAHDREVFAVMFLDNQHQLISFEELFFGTIDAASIYPREVLKVALNHNAAAVVFAHNHPSGIAEPSQADRRITQRLVDALKLVDIRVLDHIVVGEDCVSFAEKGWI
ncbi:CP4-6 prophage; RadC-like JAB domain-containing protein YkfG [Vibrio crassostreae]|uniref:RadC family protein n=1 Tax=Vibrio sp. 10N.247.311.64 TaxID=3229997 RepID=UPI002A6D9329|nr:CP4-6 prophage; RadC-like JAB domain-containing protein YkfG [Vibrio crassostreae]CAK2222591.1 CP4-6 prophage; RadC-like JAB domain-containing protein YkfG [Vibrio crassostreae]CAK2681683.1 CP4-6 prophage; RadC-like JAB domain-containing protein YkfG [Vibrio crassostreae]CAK3069774.1 CP4-6 prophage; RadC-like JAB domain-containing protein YkfG [Vibrio crassostreae]CAK3073487.1 CP4-6 prophage; RadC-like JAB domain-containing protein YkfG [Vibrio crassostreae]